MRIIQEHPQLFAWLFAIINVLWIVFTYFNKQRHDKAIENLRHSLNLEAERRKKIFELKVRQYEIYVANLDMFGKKHQVDLPARMQPIIDKYVSGYLAATDQDNKRKQQEIVAWFSAQVSELMREGLEEYLRLQSESNQLKLTASEAMLSTFGELESLMSESITKSNEFMSKFTELILRQDQETVNRYQRELEQCGRAIKDKAQELMRRMRADLTEI